MTLDLQSPVRDNSLSLDKLKFKKKKKKFPIFLAAESMNTISTSFKQEKDYFFLYKDLSPAKL